MPLPTSPFLPPPSGSAELRASYEAVAYGGHVIRLADPDAMAAVATLHGMTPPPADRCRVLELGCASAVNLTSMAFRNPKSTFVGVDFVPAQIESGRFIASELGLRNIELQARSITDIADADGMFDYIICHGVYSWVPPEVQDGILRVCDRNLSPNGVAYVSYNTHPGWHHRGMLRDMLLFHDDPTLDPDERVARARAFARNLASADPSNDSPHALALRQEATRLEAQTDRHIFHEQLEPWNEALYFTEFTRRAAAHHLAYVADAEMVDAAGTTSLPEGLESTDDHLRAEQYNDFVRGRTFRRSLLCHDTVTTSPRPVHEAVRRLTTRSRVVPVTPSAEDAARGPSVAAFQSPEGRRVTTNNRMVASLLTTLTSVTPAVLPYDDLKHQIAEQLVAMKAPHSDDAPTIDDETLTAAMVMCAMAGFLEFRVLPSKLVVAAGSRPKASALARWQALYFDEVSSLGHWRQPLIGMARFLIVYLDGTRDRAQLVRVTEHAFASGELKLDGFVPTRESVSAIVEEILEQLARDALLVA